MAVRGAPPMDAGRHCKSADAQRRRRCNAVNGIGMPLTRCYKWHHLHFEVVQLQMRPAVPNKFSQLMQSNAPAAAVAEAVAWAACLLAAASLELPVSDRPVRPSLRPPRAGPKQPRCRDPQAQKLPGFLQNRVRCACH